MHHTSTLFTNASRLNKLHGDWTDLFIPVTEFSVQKITFVLMKYLKFMDIASVEKFFNTNL